MTRIRSGRLDYVGDEVGLRGQEEWSISIDPDGSRTLAGHCRMFDTVIERWAVHSVDARMVPVRSFVSQRQRHRFLGEGRFWFEPGLLSGHTHVAGRGEIRQEVRIDGEIDYFVPHLVAADAWITPPCPRTGEWQEIRHGYASSLLADGATGPLIEHHDGLRMRFLGTETVTVPAGTFETAHVAVSVREGVEEHLWVSDDDFCMLVRLRSDRLATTYVLATLEESSWST